MKQEKWFKVPGFEDELEVTKSGKCRRYITHYKKCGYIQLRLNGKTVSLHQLILKTFGIEVPSGYFINHKNGVKHDNRLSNLEVVTPQQNSIHSTSRKKYKRNWTRIEMQMVEKLRDSGFSIDQIASIFDCGRINVQSNLYWYQRKWKSSKYVSSTEWRKGGKYV